MPKAQGFELTVELILYAVDADRPEAVLDYMKTNIGSFPTIPSASLSPPSNPRNSLPEPLSTSQTKPVFHAAGPLHMLPSLLPLPFLLLCLSQSYSSYTSDVPF